MRKATTHRLKNGLRLITLHLPDYHSVTTFLSIRSGSRYEQPQESGIAHFLEHMVFKGTKKYPSTAEIAQALEGVGGSFNAWTSVDHTAYYNTVPKDRWQIGLEVPFELAYQALLRKEDLDRERGVIIEEMRMIQDDPARYVFDISEEIVFAGHPLGQSIIGTEETVTKMRIEDFIRYRSAHYSLNQSVVAVIGNIDEEKVIEKISQLTDQVNRDRSSQSPLFEGESKPRVKVTTKDTDQTHFVLALAHPKLSLVSHDYYAAEVLNTVLGQGMSSRLFLKVREEKGLAYSVRSEVSNLEETGVLAVSGGINTQKITQALEAVEVELDRLASDLVEPSELEKVKQLIIGSYDLKSDRAFDLARFYALGELLSVQDDIENVKARFARVTAKEVLTLAQELLKPNNRTLAVIGPYSSSDRFLRFVDQEK